MDVRGEVAVIWKTLLVAEQSFRRAGAPELLRDVAEGVDDGTVDRWLAVGAGYDCYASLTSRRYLLDFVERRGCHLDASFMVTMKPGTTECFVFTKRPG